VRIALTGGIAAGKSTVGARLAELGAVVVDADRLAREAVSPGSEGLARIAESFGPAVIAEDGSLDRAALGAIVFADPERRRELEAITHPVVRRLAAERMSAAESADPDAVVVYDVPLLVESGPDHGFELVVVAHAPATVRIERMVALRGMDRAEAQRRVGAQASDAERLAVADVVIDTGGTLDATLEQVDRLWERVGGRS
jgi:dephospho-CoA kinase